MIQEHLIKFTYFKPSGKYYSEGSKVMAVEMCGPESRTVYMDSVLSQVRQLIESGSPLPGLAGPWRDGFILVETEEGVPCLLMPQEES